MKGPDNAFLMLGIRDSPIRFGQLLVHENRHVWRIDKAESTLLMVKLD
jgi:hypothetical protein